MVSEVAQKFTNLWLQMFDSSFQFNRSLLLMTDMKEHPTEEYLNQC